jgi:transglutaminase-like putative cysteine protease
MRRGVWNNSSMQRSVTTHLAIDVAEPATLVLEIAIAQDYLDAGAATEELTIATDAGALEPTQILTQHGTRVHVLEAPTGALTIDYSATITGRIDPAPVVQWDTLRYVRPSRYCESDVLAPTALAEFRDVPRQDLLAAVSSWVGTRLSYVPGSSQPTDGAASTLLSRQGVCRDYSHLVVSLLRGLDVPARVVGVYAPGIDPMDFHAVAEAYVDGGWYVVDATTLGPRQSFVRMATGDDAADIAFLSIHRGRATVTEQTVTATVDELPTDDITRLVAIG